MSDGIQHTTTVGGETITIDFKNHYEGTDKVKNHQIFVVKAEFAKQYPEYAKMNSMDLFKNTDIQKFLHNPNGPAALDMKYSKTNYFLDGQLLTDDSEELKKIKHNEMFNDKMDKILSE